MVAEEIAKPVEVFAEEIEEVDKVAAEEVEGDVIENEALSALALLVEETAM